VWTRQPARSMAARCSSGMLSAPTASRRTFTGMPARQRSASASAMSAPTWPSPQKYSAYVIDVRAARMAASFAGKIASPLTSRVARLPRVIGVVTCASRVGTKAGSSMATEGTRSCAGGAGRTARTTTTAKTTTATASRTSPRRRRGRFSLRGLSDVAHDPHPHAERVAGQVGQGQILDVDHLQAGPVGAGFDRARLSQAPRGGDRIIAPEVLEDLVDLTADLSDGGADGVGDGLVRHVHDLGDAGHALGNEEAAAADGDQRLLACVGLHPVHALLDRRVYPRHGALHRVAGQGRDAGALA